MGQVLQQAGAAGALAEQGLVQPSHLAARNADSAHALEQGLAGNKTYELHHDRQEAEPVLGALGVGGKAGVLHDVGAQENEAAEFVELAVVAHGNDEWAVLGLKQAIGHDGRVGIAVTLRVMAQGQGFQAVVAADAKAAVVQGKLNEPTLAGALALEQGGQHGLGGVHAGHHVHHSDAKFERRLTGLTVDGHEPGLGLNDQIVARAAGLGA